MPNAAGRELVGVIIVDLVASANVAVVDIFLENNGTFDYRITKARHYTLRFAARLIEMAHRPNVVRVWYHPRLAAYYLQLSRIWWPGRVTGHAGWQDHDGQAIT